MATFWIPNHSDTFIDYEFDNLQYPANQYDMFRAEVYENGVFQGNSDTTTTVTTYGVAFRLGVSGLIDGATYSMKGYAKWSGTMYYIGEDSFVYYAPPPPATRPPDFSWDTSKISGSNFNLTASEWTRLQNRINDFRTYKGLDYYSFTNVYSGDLVEAYLYRQAVSSISDMSPPTSPPPNRYTGDVIFANDIDRLRVSLDSIS